MCKSRLLITVNFLGTTPGQGQSKINLISGKFRNSISLPCLFGQEQLSSSSFENKADE